MQGVRERGGASRHTARVSAAPGSVVERIKELIVREGLRPGDPLPTELELTDALGVSRSRVREAVKTLVALDIVEVRHGFGTYVGRMSLDALVQALAFRSLVGPAADQRHLLLDLIDVRQMLETSLAPVVVQQVTGEVLDALAATTQVMAAKAARGEEFREEDREFHALLVGATGNALAVQLTEAFWDVHALSTAVVGPPTDLVETAQAHVAVVDAARAGDAVALAAAIVRHYDPVRRRLDAAPLP